MKKEILSRIRGIYKWEAMSRLHPRWVEFREALEKATREEHLDEEDRLYIAFCYAEQFGWGRK